MKLMMNGTDYEVNSSPAISENHFSVSLAVEPEQIPTEISGELRLHDIIVWPKTGPITDEDESSESSEGITEDFTLYETTAESFLRYYTQGNTLVFTNEPEPEPVPPPTEEEVYEVNAMQVRAQRDALIVETDWTQLLDSPISEESREEVRVYRQALRDIPEQEGFPTNVVWPEKPAIIKGEPDPVDTAVSALVGGE